MDKTYDDVINAIKELYLKACYNNALANEYDYNGSEYYQCERTNYASGAKSAYDNLIKELGITVPQNEINAAMTAGRNQAIKINNEEDDEDDDE
jgi:hypothetical protein